MSDLDNDVFDSFSFNYEEKTPAHQRFWAYFVHNGLYRTVTTVISADTITYH